MIKISVSIFLITISICCVIITLDIHRLSQQVPVLINTQADTLRQQIFKNLLIFENQSFLLLNATRKDANYQVSETRKQAIRTIDYQLTTLQGNLNSKLDRLARKMDPLADETTKAVHDYRVSAPLIYSSIILTGKSIQSSSFLFEKNLPGAIKAGKHLEKNTDIIVGNVATFTTSFVKPTSRWQRISQVLYGGLNFGRILK